MLQRKEPSETQPQLHFGTSIPSKLRHFGLRLPRVPIPAILVSTPALSFGQPGRSKTGHDSDRMSSFVSSFFCQDGGGLDIFLSLRPLPLQAGGNMKSTPRIVSYEVVVYDLRMT